MLSMWVRQLKFLMTLSSAWWQCMPILWNLVGLLFTYYYYCCLVFAAWSSNWSFGSDYLEVLSCGFTASSATCCWGHCLGSVHTSHYLGQYDACEEVSCIALFYCLNRMSIFLTECPSWDDILNIRQWTLSNPVVFLLKINLEARILSTTAQSRFETNHL